MLAGSEQRSSGVQRNVVANLAGRIWTAATFIAFIPLYVHFLGIEAYGLVGFFVSLLALSSVLEFGLSSTVNRELARHAARNDRWHRAADMVRSLELIYWGLAVVIGLAIAALAPLLADHWFRLSDLSAANAEQAVLVMAAVLAFQWPINFYSGGLLGMQRQVLLNVVLAVMMTVRNGGAAAALWLISPSLTTFFAWQLAGAALQALILRTLLWRLVKREGTRPRFRLSAVRGVWGFALGMSAMSVLVVILTQADKLLLSHLLELRQFGYYSLAASLAAAVAYLTLPVFQAVFPRLSGLVALDDEAATAVLYHRASQAVAVLVIPVASVLAVFSFQVIFVWTGNPTTAGNADTVTTLLVVGGLLNALVNVPYALQLAHGWTRLPLTVNAVAVVIFVPLLVVLGKRYGGVGAAALWVAVNAAYLLVSVSVMHRRLLPREKWRWYLRDVLVPVAGAGAVVGAARLVWPATDSRALTALLLAIVLALAAAVVVALTPYASERARSLLRRQALAKSPAGADLGSDSSVRSQRSRERSVQSR